MRREIERRLKITTRDIYGLSEVMGPGVSFECSDQSGLHVNEDHFIPEIVNPDTGEALPVGTSGELVFTCITKQAFPLLRYRTHDVCRLDTTPCACGRTLIKMSKPAGRTDDMLIIRGVNVFPSQIESVLLEFSDTAPYYQLVGDRKGCLTRLEITGRAGRAQFSDQVRQLEALTGTSARTSSQPRHSRQGHPREPHTLSRSEGKSKRYLTREAYGISYE